MKESGYDPDTIEDGRNDSAWVADCLRILGQWVASINDYHGRRQWITPSQQEKDKRGEVGFTG